MPEAWIGFNSRDRQRLWWRTGILTSALVGVIGTMSLTTHEPGRWWWVGGMGAFSVVVLLSTINLIYGQVLLTTTGLEFRTFVSRRVVPWSEVARIEERQRVSRSGTWSELRVIRAHGRSLTLPGTLTNRVMDAELQRKQAVIQERWSLAIGG
ncbi:PH domain-containing protein [Streptomyces cylindrosporus]|uniref:PH domain-containing protein n=1 Tax=Streptomyces cylindrosporus TaxID=2927583 RepID=A0ABS9YJ86_9ACTN|nr:PH domain-containing protein [Streptomyces cylindrosporus]MCI3276641.1 PH domain-containing protein [Streptomyces cylindrosporus]